MKYFALGILILFQSCASNPNKLDFKGTKTSDKLLDTEFIEVTMRGNIMGELNYLFKSVRMNTPHKNASFGVELDHNIDPYWREGDRFTKEIEKYDKRIKIHSRNVTLREVLFAMTSQAGWDYYIAPQEIMFVAGPNVTRKIRSQSSWACESISVGAQITP